MAGQIQSMHLPDAGAVEISSGPLYHIYYKRFAVFFVDGHSICDMKNPECGFIPFPTPNQNQIAMKPPSNALLALAAILFAGAFSSCASHETPPSVNTGNAVTSTTIEKDVPYSGSDTIRRQTSVRIPTQD